MTPRTGFRVALVGLVMAVVCLATLYLLRDLEGGDLDTMSGLMIAGMGFIFVLLLDLGAILGLIAMVVGLVRALKKQTVKPS